MTVYRRRLALSFEALKRTPNGRLMRTGGISEEDACQDETRDQVISAEASTAAFVAVLEVQDRTNDLLRRIAQFRDGQQGAAPTHPAAPNASSTLAFWLGPSPHHVARNGMRMTKSRLSVRTPKGGDRLAGWGAVDVLLDSGHVS
jgi:hypothetical protein